MLPVCDQVPVFGTYSRADVSSSLNPPATRTLPFVSTTGTKGPARDVLMRPVAVHFPESRIRRDRRTSGRRHRRRPLPKPGRQPTPRRNPALGTPTCCRSESTSRSPGRRSLPSWCCVVPGGASGDEHSSISEPGGERRPPPGIHVSSGRPRPGRRGRSSATLSGALPPPPPPPNARTRPSLSAIVMPSFPRSLAGLPVVRQATAVVAPGEADAGAVTAVAEADGIRDGRRRSEPPPARRAPPSTSRPMAPAPAPARARARARPRPRPPRARARARPAAPAPAPAPGERASSFEGTSTARESRAAVGSMGTQPGRCRPPASGPGRGRLPASRRSAGRNRLRSTGSCGSLLRSREAAIVGVERGPQLTDRVVEAGPRGPNGDAQGRRDLRQRVPEVVMEHDDRPLFR